MSRVQLALNVPDIDEAVAFYSKLFATEPAKRKPGYANFAIADPPLKLVLFEKPDAAGPQPPRGRGRGQRRGRGHPGPPGRRGLATPLEESGTCCFAKQDKVWVDGPDGAVGDLHRPRRQRTSTCWRGRGRGRTASSVEVPGDDHPLGRLGRTRDRSRAPDRPRRPRAVAMAGAPPRSRPVRPRRCCTSAATTSHCSVTLKARWSGRCPTGRTSPASSALPRSAVAPRRLPTNLVNVLPHPVQVGATRPPLRPDPVQPPGAHGIVDHQPGLGRHLEVLGLPWAG